MEIAIGLSIAVIQMAVSYLGAYFIALRLGEALNRWSGRLWISMPVSLFAYFVSLLLINIFFGVFLIQSLVEILGEELALTSVWITMLLISPLLIVAIHGFFVFFFIFLLIRNLRKHRSTTYPH